MSNQHYTNGHCVVGSASHSCRWHAWVIGVMVVFGNAAHVNLAWAVPPTRASMPRVFTSSASGPGGLLGFSTSLTDNGRVFLGAPAGTQRPGRAGLFQPDGTLFDILVASSPRTDDLFGFDSEASGNIVVTSDPANPFASSPQPGSVYLFDANTSDELLRLQPNDSAGGDEFGFSVGIDENLVVIGSTELRDGVGKAYLFEATTGTQLQRLVPNDPLAGSEFGYDVAVDASISRAVVGAKGDFATLGPTKGSAYVFDTFTGGQTFKLQPAAGTDGDEFGFDVSMQGPVAVIGAPDGGEGEGAAYLFNVQTGQELFRLQPHDSHAGNDFGVTVDIEGDVVAVGAPRLGISHGSVYLFNRKTGEEILEIEAPASVDSDDFFGVSVDLLRNQLLVGAPKHDALATDDGAGYLYEILLTGDFNRNLMLDAGDIDLLSEAIRNGATTVDMDLNEDLSVNQSDRRVWVEQLSNTWFGDANLDGLFDPTDLIEVLQAGKYENGRNFDAGWAEGDFDGNGDFESKDLITALAGGGYLRGPRSAAVIVPEPSALFLLATGLLLLIRRR